MCYRPSMGSRTLNADVAKFFLGVYGPRRRHHINMQKPREISYKVGHTMLPLPLCTFILLYLSCLFHSDPLTLTPCNTSYTWKEKKYLEKVVSFTTQTNIIYISSELNFSWKKKKPFWRALGSNFFPRKLISNNFYYIYIWNSNLRALKKISFASWNITL